MSSSSPSLHVVAKLDELPDGSVLGVETPTGERICLARVGDRVYAVADECTHQGFPMSAGEVCPDGTIQCSWHGAKFDCATGAVLREPATEPLPTYAVRVVDGEIHVGGRT